MSTFVGSDVARARSRVATSTRLGTAEDVDQARRDLAAAKLRTYVDKVLADAPPLTDDQRRAITRLLMGGGRVA